MPRAIDAILDSRAASLAGRVLLTFPFWSSGIAKLVNWQATLGEMSHFNLNPPALFGAATIVTQLGGSALVLWGPLAWLGAGWLAVFTLLTIPIAHAFWAMSGQAATLEMYTAFEHLALVGGLILAAALRRRETR
jgi:transmembrane protein